MSRPKWIACAICATAFLVAISGSGIAATSCSISQVKVSPDFRRVVVKANGPIKEHVVSSLDRPHRLVIDMAGVRPGEFQPPVAATGRGGIEVRVSGTTSGSRLVLDFGESALPEYKIRSVDNYLMVFLGNWTPSLSRTLKAVPAEPAPKPVFQATPPKRVQPITVPGASKTPVFGQTISEKRSAHSPMVTGKEDGRTDKSDLRPGALSIKSAQVIADVIVLQIANRDRPGYLYRLELAVDLERRRLSLAKIEPVTDGDRVPVQLTSKTGGSDRRAVAHTRMGPRKNPLTGLTARKHTLSSSPLRKAGITAHTNVREVSVRGPRKNDQPSLRLTGPSQSQPQSPPSGYWGTAATMFQDHQGDLSRTIFPRVIGCCFYATELD